MTDQGPVIDWLAEKWDALLKLVQMFLAFAESIPLRVEARVDAAESKLILVMIGVGLFLGFIHLAHGWITRKVP